MGLTRKQILKGIDFNVSDVVWAVVSHRHSDHAKAVKDFENMGIPVFKPYEIKTNTQNKWLGSLQITTFDLPHNGTENRGFFIRTLDNQRILYLTDFEYCRYSFTEQKVNHILIEANHSKELLDREKANYIHSIRGHASIDTTCKFLEANKTSYLRTVILVHLSSECGDEKMFKEMAEKVVGCPVYIAKAGLEIELKESNCPF